MKRNDARRDARRAELASTWTRHAAMAVVGMAAAVAVAVATAVAAESVAETAAVAAESVADAAALALPSRAEVLARMDRANQRWIDDHPDPGNNEWDNAVYHLGNLAAHAASGNPRYLAYSMTLASKLHWQLDDGRDTNHADFHAVGQVYLGLSSDPAQLASLKRQEDRIVDQDVHREWTWIDAIFMQMNVMTELGNRYGNTPRDYHEQMYRMFRFTRTELGLFDTTTPTSNLWFRDTEWKYPQHRSPHGRKVLWSRGNAWVFASLATTLESLPSNDPHRAEYLEVFQAMAPALRQRQREDGFWNSNLDDPDHHGGPESSGTAGFVYGMATGIRLGLVPRDEFLPVVVRGWRALTTRALRPNGLPGYCQSIAAAPAAAPANYTANFCLGLFLMAGKAVAALAPPL